MGIILSAEKNKMGEFTKNCFKMASLLVKHLRFGQLGDHDDSDDDYYDNDDDNDDSNSDDDDAYEERVSPFH